MKTALLALLTALLSTPHGDLPTTFKQMNQSTKGPFGKNVLQGALERIEVTQGRTPAQFQFQAAYRGPIAQELIAGFGFYVGNLFTTNYYELMGEYVFGNPASSHGLDHAGLLARKAAALPKATQMIRHWVLEKDYAQRFPDTRLARAFQVRGISSYENEVEYAAYFFDFYLAASDDEFDYLPAFLLATRSPILASTSLARARDLVAAAYDDVRAILGADHPMARALYKIRNKIHNQVSESSIGDIDRFLRTYPEYRDLGFPPPPPVDPTVDPATLPPPLPSRTGPRVDLDEVRRILVEYYGYSAAKLAREAGNLGLAQMKEIAMRISKNGATPETILELSAVAAAQRVELSGTGAIPFGKKARGLALLVNASRYLEKEIIRLRASPRRGELARAVLNTIYLEGFLIRDNWNYFGAELARSADHTRTLRNIIDVAGGDSVADAFVPALDQWRSIEPKMQGFIDGTIKSSAIAVAAILAETPPK